MIHEATALIERLQASGGTMVVPDPDADTRARYRRAIHAAKQHNLVPDGHDLRHTGRNTGDLVVRLYSAAQPYDTDWNRLRLNQGDIRARPPADYSALEEDPTNLQVAPESIARVLGLLRMIDEAGASRKCRVGVNLATKHPKPFVKVGGVRRSLDVFEEYDQVPHTLTADERRTKRLRPWAHIPEFDSVATGRLRLEVGKSQSDQRLTWRDTTTVKLEQQTSRIVADIIKAVEKDERAAAARRQREAGTTGRGKTRRATGSRGTPPPRHRTHGGVGARHRGSPPPRHRGAPQGDIHHRVTAVAESRRHSGVLRRPRTRRHRRTGGGEQRRTRRLVDLGTRSR